MKLKNLIYEDFVNYSKPSMFIAMPKCSFKCDKEAGCKVCQNSDLAAAPVVDISIEELAKRYATNPITEAFVFGGLESFDTFEDLYLLIMTIRETCMDDIVIYTGYYPSEIKEKLKCLKYIKDGENIIIKFGRFIPDQPPHKDEVLGVQLASPNQFAINLKDYSFEELILLENEYRGKC